MINLRIDVAIGDENVRPSVIVEIYKLRAEAEERNAYRSKTPRPGHIGEFAAVVVMVEIIGIIGKVRLDNVRPAIVIVICRIDTHAGLLASVGAVCDTRLGSNFCEDTFAIVMVEQRRRRIVRHVKIEAAVQIVIEPKYAYAIIAAWVDAQFLTYSLECAAS